MSVCQIDIYCEIKTLEYSFLSNLYCVKMSLGEGFEMSCGDYEKQLFWKDLLMPFLFSLPIKLKLVLN